jgi:hypothetical protein
MVAQKHEIAPSGLGTGQNERAAETASSREWFGGGVASIAAGVLLILGHLVDGGASGAGTSVLGLSLVLVAHLIMVLALVGIYAAQSSRMGFIGFLGMILSVLGTALVSGVVLVEIAGAGGVAVEGVLRGGVAGMLAQFAGLGFFVGLLLFASGTLRARVFPRGTGLLLIVGDLVFAASSSVGTAAWLLVISGSVLTGAGFVWLGLLLLVRAQNERRTL